MTSLGSTQSLHTRRIKAEEEVTYEEWKDRGSAAIQAKPGYRKIVDFCRKARRDGFKLVWADTCCINKKDSTELMEAIQSMFRWCERSSICYVYLDGIVIDPNSQLRRWRT